MRLWGIDNRDTASDLMARCSARGTVVRQVIVIVLACAAGGALAAVTVALLGLSAPWRWCTFLAAALGAAVTAALFERRRVSKVMPATLREAGRCEGCGYDLSRTNAVRCPECGRAAPVVDGRKGHDGGSGRSERVTP